jgi:hypothetical protein
MHLEAERKRLAWCLSRSGAIQARLRPGFVGHFSFQLGKKSGGPDRDQTDDLVVANDALYQLSYWPMGKGRYWEIAACK